MEEFKYPGVLFMSEGRMEREIDRRIGAVRSDAGSASACRGEGGLNLPVNLRSYPQMED